MKKNFLATPFRVYEKQLKVSSAKLGSSDVSTEKMSKLSGENERLKEEKAAIENHVSILMDTVNDLSHDKKELSVKAAENDSLKKQISQLTETVHTQQNQIRDLKPQSRKLQRLRYRLKEQRKRTRQLYSIQEKL